MKKTLAESSPCLSFSSLCLFITVFLVGFGQLQRIQLTNQVAFYAHDLFIILFILTISITSIAKYKKNNIVSPKSLFQRWKSLLMFLVWSVGGLLVNQAIAGFAIMPWLYLVRLFTYLLFAFSLFIFSSSGECQKKSLRFSFWLLSLLILAIGFFQYLFIPDLRFLGSQGWDVHYFRLAGNMLDPNFTGMLLINILITFSLTKLLSCRSRLQLGLVFIIALALTYSRSSYLALLMVVLTSLIIKLWRHSKSSAQSFRPVNKLLSFYLLALVILIPFLPKPGGLGVELTRSETIRSRAEVNESVISEIKISDLLIGNGLFTPTVNLEQTNAIVHTKFPDNLIVFLLSGAGLPGLGLFATFMIGEFSRFIKNRKYLSLSLLTGALTHSMFNLTILEPINLLVLIICLQTAHFFSTQEKTAS